MINKCILGNKFWRKLGQNRYENREEDRSRQERKDLLNTVY